MIKVLHTADWHYRDQQHDEIEKCVDFLIASARQENPDLILISGDITDNQNLKLDSRSARTICRQVSELACIAPVAIIIGTPSHDGKSAEILRYVKGQYQVHVSEHPEQLILSGGRLYAADSGDYEGNAIDAIITQVPTPTKQFFQSEAGIAESDQQVASLLSNLLGAFGTVASQFQCPHIVSGHFQMGGAYISETQQLIGRDIEISIDQMAMANAHLVALGHIHKSQKVGGNIFYSGSIHRNTFGETEEKGFYIHTISVAGQNYFYGVNSKFLQTPARQMLKISEDFTEEGNDIRELDAVICTYGPEDLYGAHLKLEIKVWQDEAGRIKQAEIERYLLDAGAEKVVISLIRVPRETVRATRVLKAESLRDKVLAMADLRGETVTASILNKAAELETINPDELIKLVTAGRAA